MLKPLYRTVKQLPPKSVHNSVDYLWVCLWKRAIPGLGEIVRFLSL